jgi:hypothetical protein
VRKQDGGVDENARRDAWLKAFGRVGTCERRRRMSDDVGGACWVAATEGERGERRGGGVTTVGGEAVRLGRNYILALIIVIAKANCNGNCLRFIFMVNR